jgi:putative peptidoglycan lipid II flippase
MNRENTEKRSAGKSNSSHSAFLVGTGILFSRLAGLVRDRVFAHFFGNSDAADAFRGAFRIPNLLQNLFGEGVLSASFIPVYSQLLAKKEEEEAGKVAGAIAAILSLVVSVLVVFGITFTPLLIDLITPGFQGSKQELAIQLVRILFPGSGLLVLSAWCLGILNSHRRFFLSYAAPVIWNAIIIVALIGFGTRQTQFDLAATAAWGSVAGSLLQLIVQLPVVLKLCRRISFSLFHRSQDVLTVIRNFVPVFFSRGVTQISAYIDSLISSLLPTGALAGLSYAQTLYILPVSLFGMSVSASELPAMSSALGNEQEVARYLRQRLNSGLRQIAFFIIPSTVAFLTLGDIITAAIYQSGRFTGEDAVFVWGILAGSALGMLAATLGRLYSSTYYALRDTRTPLYFALIRVFLSTGLGFYAAIYLPSQLNFNPRWGVAGLTFASGLAALLEYWLLRQTMIRRIGETGLPWGLVFQLWGAAAISAAAGWGVKLATVPMHPIPRALLVLGPFVLLYFVLTLLFKVPEVQSMVAKFPSAQTLLKNFSRPKEK